MKFDTVKSECSICWKVLWTPAKFRFCTLYKLRVQGYNFKKRCDYLNLANSGDPDEMPLYVAFHLGLHC